MVENNDDSSADLEEVLVTHIVTTEHKMLAEGLCLANTPTNKLDGVVKAQTDIDSIQNLVNLLL